MVSNWDIHPVFAKTVFIDIEMSMATEKGSVRELL